MDYVIKRNGTKVPFDKSKIVNAIEKAMNDSTDVVDHKLSEAIASEIAAIDTAMDVEAIQNAVENRLMQSGCYETARCYMNYRYLHGLARNNYKELMNAVEEKLLGKKIDNQNANVDEASFGGRIGEMSRVVAKRYALDYCMSDMARRNHENNEIYIHDLDSYAVGMHNCADGSMWVRIKQDGFPRTITLSDFAKELNLEEGKFADVSKSDFEILSKDGWTKLLNVSCRRLGDAEKLFTISTRTGLPLKLTGKHRVPVVENGEEVIKNVEDLTTSDVLLNVGDIQLSTEEIASSFMDLTKLNDPVMDLRITNLSPLKSYLRYKYNIPFAEYARNNKFRFPANADYMDIHDYKKLCKEYPLSFELISQLRIKSCGSKHDYPLFIPYTKELAKVYAYIYADGGVYIDEDQSLFQLTFTNTNEALVDDFIDCYESCFGYRLNKSYAKSWYTSPCTRVTDGSRLIVKIFKEYAGARKFGANDISMPDFVMSGSDDIKYAYLSACIDSDGCMSNFIAYSSCCKRYCDQLCVVLESLGYHPTVIQDGNKGDIYRFGVKTGHRNFDSYRVSIYRGDEKYTLQSKMSTLKYNDEYCYRGMVGKYNEDKIISISSSCPQTLVYDMETMSHWYVINNYVSHNCLSIPFDDLLAKGFNTRQTDVRPAQSISTAFQLVAVIFQVQSLQQFGGVSATHLDWTMVPYVRKSFKKHFRDGCKYLLGDESKCPSEDNLSIEDEKYKNIDSVVYNYAMDMTKRELNQAVEGMYHNLNTLQSRSGNQLPFTSINYGTCTLPEGRLVTKALLEASIKGIGKLHRTSIFPCGIFQMMKGVNRKEGDPNYDLYKLALRSTAQRLYPNYVNVDWSANAGYDRNDPRTYTSTMGCRTYNGYDINGLGQLKDGRGNICPVTIIMPTLAMEAKDIVGEDAAEPELFDKFMDILDTKIHEAKDMLIERFEWICSQNPASAKFMWENETMTGYIPEEGIRSALKHGTLGIGQIGLAETLQILVRCNQINPHGMELAKKIESLFKQRCDEFKHEYSLNFGVYMSPAENLCFTSMTKFKEKYGEISNVSDKKFFTNSVHCPVWEELTPFEKIDIESILDNYSNAGAILYVELDAGVKNNLNALETIVNYAMDHDVPYFAVNVPNDTCMDCGYCDEMNDVCPVCGGDKIQRLRRVTGYLTGNYTTAFNLGKQQEVELRVKHNRVVHLSDN